MRHVDTGHRARRLTAALAVAASVGMVATPVLAADTLDQSQAAASTTDFIHDRIVAAQTFTPGRTGSLNRIDLSVGWVPEAGNATVSIETAPGGIPSGTVLATRTLDASVVTPDGSIHSVSITLPPSLSTAGDQYAIVLAAPDAQPDTAWLWKMDGSDVYGGGTALQGDTVAVTWTPSSRDYTFATYVDPVRCEPGYYSVTGYGPCSAAEPGHYVADRGSLAQSPCELGTYQPGAASVSCIAAPVGSYVDVLGALAPIQCPDGATTAETGSTGVHDCVSDTSPPVITPTVTGTLGLNGWYTSDVTLTWSVDEPETPGSLVTTGCADQAVTTDQDATTYSCSATSLGGSAGPVTVTIKRDATPPAIACSASPNVLWPPNGRLVPVTVAVTAEGASFSLVSVTASAGVAGDMQGWSTGTADTAGLLRAMRSGSSGARTYTLAYQATDDAGNTADCSTTVVVPHDMGVR